jgi:hypothetical protein
MMLGLVDGAANACAGGAKTAMSAPNKVMNRCMTFAERLAGYRFLRAVFFTGLAFLAGFDFRAGFAARSSVFGAIILEGSPGFATFASCTFAFQLFGAGMPRLLHDRPFSVHRARHSSCVMPLSSSSTPN